MDGNKIMISKNYLKQLAVFFIFFISITTYAENFHRVSIVNDFSLELPSYWDLQLFDPNTSSPQGKILEGGPDDSSAVITIAILTPPPYTEEFLETLQDEGARTFAQLMQIGLENNLSNSYQEELTVDIINAEVGTLNNKKVLFASFRIRNENNAGIMFYAQIPTSRAFFQIALTFNDAPTSDIGPILGRIINSIKF